MSVIRIGNNQSIWDIAIQKYGSVEGVFPFLKDNEGMNLDTNLTGGQLVKINSEPIDKSVSDHYSKNNLLPVSQLPLEGDFNDDYNDDFYI